MKLLARLLWILAPTEAGLRAFNMMDDNWLGHKVNYVGMPIWRGIRSYAVGHTVCYRWATRITARINAKTCGGPKFRCDIPLDFSG